MSRILLPIVVCGLIITALYFMLGRELESERSKRIELEAERVVIGLGVRAFESQIEILELDIATLKSIISTKDMLLSIWAGEYPNKKIYKTLPDSLLAVPPKDSVGQVIWLPDGSYKIKPLTQVR